MAQVSVIIPALNAAATIARTLESVFAQTYTDFEIIVVNDGSTDGTVRVLAGYGDRLKVVSQENRGISAARNAGARASSGRYLAFLDADDLWLPDKLRRTVAVLHDEPECAIVVSNAWQADESGTISGATTVPAELNRQPSRDDVIAGWGATVPSSFVVRRAAFDRCGGFDEHFHGSGGCEDVLFLAMAGDCGTIRYLPEPLLLYRTTPLERRVDKYTPNRRAFVRLVRERYGAGARAPLKRRIRMWARSWNRAGLEAMERGDLKFARHAFLSAARLEPLRPKSTLRWLRTFLPAGLRRALSGKAARQLANGRAVS
jgi:glycosyltransferase involved in cell wall biosynthesis